MTLHIALVIAVGAGATLFIDAWNLILKRLFSVPSLSYCLLGRWVAHMPSGVFRHRSIGAAAPKAFECPAGWLAHYAIGVGLAAVYLCALAPGWFARPTPVPALLYGIATVVFPFFVMQPSLGLGFASAGTRHPMRARAKSLLTHSVYGVGLYASARIVAFVIAR